MIDLQIFGGSGTVGEFCRNNERNAILFELNPEYSKLINERAMITTPELSSWCSTKKDA
jgi:DNA modification methylase